MLYQPRSRPARLRRSLSILVQRPPGRESVIDGVRAIAILWVFLLHVVFFHFGTFPGTVMGIFSGTWTQWIRQGVLGVDLFFVISGYLIGSILLTEYRESGGIQLRRFYARRFLRLIPVYVAVMLLAAPFLQDIPRTAILADISPTGNLENAWSNLLYVNNFVTIQEQYMGWCWSLAIEEQFYMLAPLLLLLVLGRSRRPLVWMFVLLALSGFIRLAIIRGYGFVPPFQDSPDMPSWSLRFDTIYDKLHVRYGGLLAGVIGAYLSVFHPEKLRAWIGGRGRATAIAVVSLCVFGYIACLSFSSPQFEHMPTWLAQVMHSHHRDVFSVAALLIILVAIHGRGPVAAGLQRSLSSRLLYPIAQLSYSIYLVHEVVMIWVFPKTTAYLTGELGWGAGAVMAFNGALAVLLTATVAGLLFVLVEHPSMEYRKSERFRRLAGA